MMTVIDSEIWKIQTVIQLSLEVKQEELQVKNIQFFRIFVSCWRCHAAQLVISSGR
jgi:hypothetical protein